LRRATLDGRRRLRLIVFGIALAAGLPTLLYILPAIALGFALIPDWLVLVCLLVAPLSYVYATVRHNLFGIDRLLNHALVYALLSLGILGLYLGSFLMIYRFLPGDWLLEVISAAGLTLLVGLTFEWTRRRIQHRVDRLFYGGWYDYPGVVETVSDILARTLDREQLTTVLTHQIPALMHLRGAHLHIGAPDQLPNFPISPSPNSSSPTLPLSHTPTLPLSHSPTLPHSHSPTLPPSHSPTLPHSHPPTPPLSHPPTLQYPLSFQNQPRGLWTVGPRRDGDDFSAADRRILTTLAREAEIALGNVLLVETLRGQLDEIRASQTSLAQMQRQLLRSREEERARLARDLHDGPIQALVGLNLQLGLALAGDRGQEAGDRGQTIEDQTKTGGAAHSGIEALAGSVVRRKQPAKASRPADDLNSYGGTALTEGLTAMRGEVRELLAELRQVCAELRPPMLDTFGLGAALAALAEEWSATSGVAVRLDLPADGSLRALPGEAAVNLYRIVQEALTNVARHAQASAVTIQAAWDDARLQLIVQDDGRGFIVPAALHELASQGHFGLAGMAERAELIGATLTVKSAPGHGTMVCATWDSRPR